MRSRSHRLLRGGTALSRLALPLAALVVAFVPSACEKKEGGQAPRPCCDQPKIPPGIPAFTVVRDEVTGPTDGRDVKLHVALKQKTKRDDIYPALQFLYRYAMTRETFEPTTFSGSFYATEGDAQTGGNALAKIWRDREDKGPKCDNFIKLEFAEEVKKAFDHSLNRAVPEDSNDSCRLSPPKKVERFDDKFTKKPAMKIDEARKAVEVTYPYVETGKDEYVEKLSFNSAMTYWAEFLTAMFKRSPQLQEVTYVGLWNDAPAVKISTTREQFDSKLSNVQETIASYAAITFAKLGLHKTDDKGALKEQEQHKTKTYKTALSMLNKDQVFVSPKLK